MAKAREREGEEDCSNGYICVTLLSRDTFALIFRRGYFLYFYSRDPLTVQTNGCTRPGTAASCTFVRHNRTPRVIKGVKPRTGLLDFYTCNARRVCAHVMHSRTCVHTCTHTHTHIYILRLRSRYLRRAGPRSRSIMYQPQMCISPRGLQDNDRSMRHARINGPHGYTCYVHTGRAPAICPLVFSPPPPALPVIAKYALIHIPYRSRWCAI